MPKFFSIVIFSFLLLFSFNVFSFNQVFAQNVSGSVEDRKKQLEAELAALEQQIKEQEALLNTQRKESGTITRDISILTGEIQKAKLAIKQKTVLINKSKFTGDGIKNFSEVKVSPDGSLMCFIGNTDSPATFLYYSDVGGKTPFRITGGKNCVWSHDSGKIAFNNVVSDVSPVDVFIFIINSKDLKNITRIVGGEFIRFYEIPEWSQDDNFIVSNFTAFDPSGTLQSYTGSSAINATTGEVVDK